MCPICPQNKEQPDEYKNWPPIRESQFELERNVLHFNDGWEEIHVVLFATPDYSVDVQHIARFDEDPDHLPRIMRSISFGPNQALALMRVLQENESRLKEDAD